jgi:hypothetical protein
LQLYSQILSGDLSARLGDPDKINSAGEKLLILFDQLWDQDDSHQSEDYSAEDSDNANSDSDSSTERVGKGGRKRKGSERIARRVVKPRRQREPSNRDSIESTKTCAEDEFDLQIATKILNRLMKSKHSWPFLEPVDPVALELEDYFEVSHFVSVDYRFNRKKQSC